MTNKVSPEAWALNRRVEVFFSRQGQVQVKQLVSSAVDRLLFSATCSNGQFTTECTFQVSINGRAFVPAIPTEPGRSFIDLPSHMGPLPVVIRVIPTTANHWEIEGQFEHRANGNLVAINAPPEFRPPQPVNLPGQRPAISVVAILSRVARCDCSGTAVSGASTGQPSSRASSYPLAANRMGYSVVGESQLHSVAARHKPRLNFDRRTIDPYTTDSSLK